MNKYFSVFILKIYSLFFFVILALLIITNSFSTLEKLIKRKEEKKINDEGQRKIANPILCEISPQKQ